MKRIFVALMLCCIARASAEVRPAPQTPLDLMNTVTIIGDVRAPQRMDFFPDMTLSVAIMIAGGVSEWGGLPIILVRDGAVFLRTNTRRVFATRNPEDPLLKPKDTIYIGYTNVPIGR